MADKIFIQVYNKQLKTEQRIAKDVFEDPANKNAFAHCEVVETKKVNVVEKKSTTKKTTTKKD